MEALTHDVIKENKGEGMVNIIKNPLGIWEHHWEHDGNTRI
jgi:hypothetical protein